MLFTQPTVLRGSRFTTNFAAQGFGYEVEGYKDKMMYSSTKFSKSWQGKADFSC